MADLAELFTGLELDVPKRTGLVYDLQMTEHESPWDTTHIEKPSRLITSLEKCKKYELIRRCIPIAPRLATIDELALVHSHEYIKFMSETEDIVDIVDLENLASRFDSVYFHPKTYECARLSAGSAIELVSSVIKGKVNNGFALIRPPGHHAMMNEACGFCFFNNIAIAAKHALQNHQLERILIVDWDVHHGQATQQMFYDDPRVLYFSIHRYEFGKFWPNLRESNFNYIGEGAGKGYNFNIPLNNTGLGNTEYLAIFHNVLLPIAYEFNPQLVLVSAGYDAAIGCPEGEMEVSPYAYAHLLNEISGLAEGRVCVILEGGYCLQSLSEAVAVTIRTLLGDPCPAIKGTSQIDESAVETILNVISGLYPMWKSLSLQDVYNSEEEGAELELYGKETHKVSVKFEGSPYLNQPPFPTRDCCPVQEESVRNAYKILIEELISNTDLTVPNHKTCLVYDERMTKHINIKDGTHPEVKERIMVIKEKLEKSGLAKKCLLLDGREASSDELALVHSQDHIEKMKSSIQMKKKEINKLEKSYESVYLSQETYNAAVIASGSLLQVVDSVITGECVNGFAIIRPPGHHAEINEACGFCIFNSVAIAAKYALNKYSHYSKPVKKVLILDWDIHHGNGTQNIYYDDCNVLYISLHRFDEGKFFPYDKDNANYTACGVKNKSEGFNINISWNGSVGDGDYLAAFANIVLPVAYEFCPDLVLVSSGFDAAINDPLGGCEVTPSFYGHMTRLLSGLANGKIILALEGGYNLPSVSEAAYHCVNALLGEPCASLNTGLYPSPSAIQTIKNVHNVQSAYWKCLRFSVAVPLYRNVFSSSCPSSNSELLRLGEKKVTIDYHVNKSSSYDVYQQCPKLYCVSPRTECPHLDSVADTPLPENGINPFAICETCNDAQENWVCLNCHKVFCGRFVHEHMLQHAKNFDHHLALSFSDFTVWCYACDDYIHNPILVPIKHHVHAAKFGKPFSEIL